MTPRLLTKKRAADYLDMSERSFDELVRPFVPVRLIRQSRKRPFVRYDVHHLDHWADQLSTMAPADARREILCKNPTDSLNVPVTGTSKKPSASAIADGDFEKRLDAARKRSNKPSPSGTDASRR